MRFLRGRTRSPQLPQSLGSKSHIDASTSPTRTPGGDIEKGNRDDTVDHSGTQQQTINASVAGFAIDNVQALPPSRQAVIDQGGVQDERPVIVDDEDEDDEDDNEEDEENRTGNRRNRSGIRARTRFEAPPPIFSKEGIRNAWDAVWCQIRNPSHPSTTSQSALEGGTDNGYGDSVTFRRPGGGSQGRSASGYEPTDEDQGGTGSIPEPVHHVVVDSDLGQYIPPSKSDNGSAATPGNGTGLPTTTDGSHLVSGSRAQDGTTGDANSIRRDRRTNWIRRTWLWEVCIERCWPAIIYFCESSFPEAAKEKSYQKEFWFAWRPAAIIASLCECVVSGDLMQGGRCKGRRFIADQLS